MKKFFALLFILSAGHAAAQTGAASSLRIELPYRANEAYLIDAADINRDGRDDFLIGFMIDPQDQIGIPCCEVPRERLADLRGNPVYLAVSGSSGYLAHPIPGSDTLRTWAGQLFSIGDDSFAYLGRNGEIGLPNHNPGEISQLVGISVTGADAEFRPVWQATRPTVTSSVELFQYAGETYILENNYGINSILGAPREPYDSVLMKVLPNGTMDGLALRGRLKSNSADNHVRVQDIDADGRPDLISAAEVWKSWDGTSLQSEWPGSYVVRDFFNKSEITPLPDPYFGNDHAGMAIGTIADGAGQIIVELSTQYLGPVEGFQSAMGIKAYRADADVEELPVDGAVNTPYGVFRGLHEARIGDQMALVVGNYGNHPQMVVSDQGRVAVRRLPIQTYKSGSRPSTIIPLSGPDCVAFATTNAWPQSSRIKVIISECID